MNEKELKKYRKLKRLYTELCIKEIEGIDTGFNWFGLKDVPCEFQSKQLVLAAVTTNGWNLKAAAEKYKADEEIVLKAVRNRGDSLEYADKKLQNNRKIVITAIKNNFEAFKFASEELQADKEIVDLAWNVAKKALSFGRTSQDFRELITACRVEVAAKERLEKIFGNVSKLADKVLDETKENEQKAINKSSKPLTPTKPLNVSEQLYKAETASQTEIKQPVEKQPEIKSTDLAKEKTQKATTSVKELHSDKNGKGME